MKIYSFFILLCCFIFNSISCYSQTYDDQLKKLNCSFPTSSIEFWDNEVPTDYEVELLDSVISKQNTAILFQHEFYNDSVEIYDENIKLIKNIDKLETDPISGSTSTGFLYNKKKYDTKYIYIKFKTDNKCIKIYPSKHYRIIYVYWYFNREFILKYKNRLTMTI